MSSEQTKTKQKKRVIVKRPRMIHIHDPNFHKRHEKLTGIVLFSSSCLPVRNSSKQYFLNVTKLFLDLRAEKIPFFTALQESEVENFVSSTFSIPEKSILFTKRMYSAKNLDIYFVEISFSGDPKLKGFKTHNILDMYSDKTTDCTDLYMNIIKQKKPNKIGINGHLRKKLGGKIVDKETKWGVPITIKQESIYQQMIGAFEISV